MFVDSPREKERDGCPDVRIVERGRSEATASAVSPGTTTVAQPLILRLVDEPVTETLIEIIDIGSGRRVVTVIEILSPANKRPGAGQELYLKKQRELIEGQVRLVEIDLLRSGQSVLSVEPHDLDYETEPDPPLAPEDAAWADALLREKGCRRGSPTPRPRRLTKRKGS